MMPRLRSVLGSVLLLGAVLSEAEGQDRRNEQFYFPGRFNWSWLRNYPEAAKLFNAFDYGHAVLYERLLTRSGTELTAALEKEFRFLTTDLLIRPPRFAVAEEAIEPTYAKLAWQAKQMFDWAHVLHRQIYDLYADERLAEAERDELIERVTDYYLSRTDYAFTPVPKSMALMDEQSFSQGFRRGHPKFNGLIWAYHWLQVGLYEPLIAAQTAADKKAGVQTTLSRFWTMLDDPPAHFPRVMPMTSTIAPAFSAGHPRAAVIFDNLHMMHDVVNDIMADERLSRSEKEVEIERMRRNMGYAAQDVVIAPGMPMHGDHAMAESAMRVPIRLPDGGWLPQGHPEARLASMEELALPMGAAPATEEGPAMEHDREPPGEAGHEHDGGAR